MDLRLEASTLCGSVTPPPSKSLSHRCLIAAALSGEETVLHHLGDSRDLQATKASLAALLDPEAETPLLPCGESGSTLRFLLPLALVLRGGGIFQGEGRLMERPLGPYERLFQEQGVAFRREGQFLHVSGSLEPGRYALPGDLSSQFVTGLLFALPLLWEDSEILLTTPLESRSYVELTLEVLKRFGVRAEWAQEGRRLFIPGNQRYRPRELTIEGDWSQAAFWYAANFLDSALSIEGLSFDSSQGDRAIVGLYSRLAQAGDVEISLRDCPDLLPPLAIMAAFREGESSFVEAKRLRFKESDRLKSCAALLQSLGGKAWEQEDGLTVRGASRLPGGVVDGAGDHRIVMAAAIAALRCEGPVTILGAEAVEKSYPLFFEEYQRLGGTVHVL